MAAQSEVATGFAVDFSPDPQWAMQWRATPELIAALRAPGPPATIRFEASGDHVRSWAPSA